MLQIYVWEDVSSYYFNGCAVAVAHSINEAIDAILKSVNDEWVKDYLNKQLNVRECCAYDIDENFKPFGFSIER